MKKRLSAFVVALLAVMTANAQVIKAEEIEQVASTLYGSSWKEAALILRDSVKLDDEGAMTFTKVIECTGTKSQLYLAANQWFTSTFDGAKDAITLNDKETGAIMAQPIVPEVAEHTGGLNHYVVSLQPVIRVDIKDNKIRFKYTLQNYEVGIIIGAGWLGDYSTLDDFDSVEKWAVKECWPYIENDKQKKTSSKAFVMGFVYSKILMNKFEKTILKSAKEAANDNW